MKAIPFSPPDISELEIAGVAETLRSGWITTGPRTKELERRLSEYIENEKRVVCLNSATAAEELNLRILGIKPGDEVIVPAYTYTASASAAIHCGATVKFVDILKDGSLESHAPEMDYDRLEKAITEKTKAVIPVDFGGIVCDYDKLYEVIKNAAYRFQPCQSDGTPLGDLGSRIQAGLGRAAVVADCAHSLGADRLVRTTGAGKLERSERRMAGTIADFSSFSFHAVKNLTTGEGGASTWRLPKSVYDNGVCDSEIYRFYQLLSLHGQNKDALAKTRASCWEYDIIGSWYKCNMTDIVAAIGLGQLDRYPELMERRKKIVEQYDAVCDELGLRHLIHHTSVMDSSNHLYIIRIPGIEVKERNGLMERMAELGVATNVHYKPLPMMTAYGRDCSAYPNSFDYYHNLITLPLHTLLSDEEADYICEVLRKVVKGYL